MSRWWKGLNAEQKEAVQTIAGPLLVLAGAGSGKTRVITHRIAYMIEQGIQPENILAVTFTNKAAEEMRERLRAMVGKIALQLTLGTFHSVGLMMWKEEVARKSKGARFVIYDTGDQLACLRQIGKRLRLERNFDLGFILSRISHYKNAFLTPAQVPWTDDPYEQAAIAFYPKYQEDMDSFAALDFDDLICKPCLAMEASASCRRRWAERFGYVLVDEYQDTNHAQLRFLQDIAGEHRNLCVVGDDDQSIYGWRGAQVKNILQFDRDFPGCKTVYLMRNYRSAGNILALANAVIAHNPDRHPKKLIPDRQPGEAVRLVICEDGDSEATWVAERIREQVDRGEFRPQDIAILYRSNRLSKDLEVSLRERRLPYRVSGGQSFFDRKEVKDFIAYLKLCVNPRDTISLRRVINFPPRGIGATTISKLVDWAEQNQAVLADALEKADRILGEGERALAPIRSFLDMVQKTRRALSSKADLVETIKALLVQTGLHDEIADGGGSGKALERRWGNVLDFVDGFANYCERAEVPSLPEYLHRLELTQLDQDSDKEKTKDRVTLSTLHGAKGLEFGMVYMVGLEEGLLPHDRVLNSSVDDVGTGDVAEERRLCYVGITRAKDRLVLTRAKQRATHGKPKPRSLSRFLSVVPEALLESCDLTRPASPQAALERLASIRAMLSGT